MYTTRNFKTKRQLKEAVQAWLAWVAFDKAHPLASYACQTDRDNDWSIASQCSHPPRPVELFAPGLGQPVRDGVEYVEGPHYPEPHRWYASVVVERGIVVKVH
jgi:hypothetical protein